jgi:magnesium transporter
MVTIYVYVRGEGLKKDVLLAELPRLLQRSDAQVWVDMLDPTDDDTDILSEIFQFHPLAIEDCILDRPHPKVDEYETYIYLVMHGIKVSPAPSANGPSAFETNEIDFFLGERFL